MVAWNRPEKTLVPGAARRSASTRRSKRGALPGRASLDRRRARAPLERTGERELGDDEDLSLHVVDRSVHLPVLVLEETERGELARRGGDLELAVPALEADEDEEALPDPSHDGAFDRDRCARHPLDHDEHDSLPRKAAAQAVPSTRHDRLDR